MRKTVSRLMLWMLLIPAALLLVAGTTTAAQAAPEAAASVGEVICAEQDGTVEVTLNAPDEAAGTFYVLLDGSSPETTPDGEGSGIEVAAGQSTTVTLTGLEDGDHTVSVDSETPEDYVTLVEVERPVACDVAPVGPYTNAAGDVYDGCEDLVYVHATNQPIAGNVADLQPVEFAVTITHAEGDEPTTLTTFTLDADNPEHDETLGPDLGGAGVVTLLADGQSIATAEYSTGCVVVEDVAGPGPLVLESAGGSGGTSTLPNTGLTEREGWLAALAVALIAGGVALIRTAQRD